MPPRTRTRNMFQFSAGSYRWRVINGTWFNGSTTNPYYRKEEYCNDTVGVYPYTENDLALHAKDVKRPLVYNGTFKYGAYEYECSGYHPAFNYCRNTYGPSTTTTSGHVPGSVSTVGYLQTELLARANPSVPDVDLLNFIWELKEFPSMLRHLGDLWSFGKNIPTYFRSGVRWNKQARSAIGGAPITVAFGWKPLLSDLRSLVATAEAIDRRLQQLREASKPGGTTTRMRIRSGQLSSSHNTQIGPFYYQVRRTTQFEEWGVLKHSIPNTGRIPYWTFEDACSLAYSTNLSAATVWNSFPWSWLIDYLYNVGSFLEAGQNRLGWKAEKALIMRKYITHCELIPYGPYPPGTQNGSMTWTSKNRNVVVNPTPVIAFRPMITSGQLTNLGALALAFATKANTKVAVTN